MTYVTSAERIGREEGRQQGLQQGLQQGKRDAIVRILRRRFGELPSDIETRLAELTLEQLDPLVEASAVEESLAQFRARLPQ